MTEPTASEHRRNEERNERGGEPSQRTRVSLLTLPGFGRPVVKIVP
jgi:hypothetical protein